MSDREVPRRRVQGGGRHAQVLLQQDMLAFGPWRYGGGQAGHRHAIQARRPMLLVIGPLLCCFFCLLPFLTWVLATLLRCSASLFLVASFLFPRIKLRAMHVSGYEDACACGMTSISILIAANLHPWVVKTMLLHVTCKLMVSKWM